MNEKNKMQVEKVEPKVNGIAMEVSTNECMEEELNTVPELSPKEKEALDNVSKHTLY